MILNRKRFKLTTVSNFDILELLWIPFIPRDITGFTKDREKREWKGALWEIKNLDYIGALP